MPARPECITPHIRFLFIALRFRLELPPHPASRRRTCPLASLRLYKPGTGTFTQLDSCHARHTRKGKRLQWEEAKVSWAHVKGSKELAYAATLQGDVDKVGQQLRACDAPARCCYPYLSSRQDQLDYQGALEQGLPIGSGEIESAHRYLVQKRLKLPGAWWTAANAEHMLALRVNRANEEWSEYWAAAA